MLETIYHNHILDLTWIPPYAKVSQLLWMRIIKKKIIFKRMWFISFLLSIMLIWSGMSVEHKTIQTQSRCYISKHIACYFAKDNSFIIFFSNDFTKTWTDWMSIHIIDQIDRKMISNTYYYITNNWNFEIIMNYFFSVHR